MKCFIKKRYTQNIGQRTDTVNTLLHHYMPFSSDIESTFTAFNKIQGIKVSKILDLTEFDIKDDGKFYKSQWSE